jgi:hypothetical protein
VRERVAAGRLNIFDWLYNMETGELAAYDPVGDEWCGLLEMVGV